MLLKKMSNSDGKKPLSFGFTKKIEKQAVIEKSTIAEKNEEVKNETDFVVELEGKAVKSVKPKEEPKELVIPLIQKNNWQRDESKNNKPKDRSNKDGDRKGGQDAKGVDNEAVNELLREAAEHNDEWQHRGQVDQNLSIPLLMRNKVPEGYEEEDRLDVSLRPQETSGEDYDNIPIEQFGMAMLRGMGFKEEEGIGDKMKKTVKPIEVTVRPKGQGLGADKRPVLPKKQVKPKPGDKKIEEEPVGIAKGVGVLVTSGPHKNLYGKIEGVDDDNARVVLKLAISNQSVTLSQYGVQLVDKDEYKKNAKDLGKFSRGHDELARQKEKDRKDDDRKRDKRDDDNGYDSSSSHRRHKDKEDRRHRKRRSDSEDRKSDHERTKRKHRDEDNYERTSGKYRDDYDSSDRKKSKTKYDDRKDDGHRHRKDDDSDRNRERYDRDRRKHRDKYSRDEDDGRTHKDRHDKKRRGDDDDADDDHSVSKPTQYWLRPDLRVRFIDKNYKKGKYYNSKVSIIDVVTRDVCTCRTDEGRLLEDIHQDMVETLIPKTEPGYIMIVNGEYKGQIGTVLKRDKVNCKAAIQLLQHRDQIMKLDYNDMCEYVGDIQANDDY